MATFTIKRGGTLLLAVLLTDATGNALNLSAVTFAGQARDQASNLVEVLSITQGTQTGTALLEATDTATWPIGRVLCDIKATAGGIVLISETFVIHVLPAVTQ